MRNVKILKGRNLFLNGLGIYTPTSHTQEHYTSTTTTSPPSYHPKEYLK